MKKKCTLISLLFALIIIGCKPVQTIQERHITTVDSTAILTLKEVISQQVQELHTMRTALEQSRQENTRLSNEILSHTINYDTGGTVDATTGKYPIASETTTSNKSVLDRTIKEHQTQVQEYERDIKAMSQRNSNLQYEVESLRDENIELKSKTTQWFNFKSFIYGIVGGFILMIVLLAFWKMK